jgi:hypothetical protein
MPPQDTVPSKFQMVLKSKILWTFVVVVVALVTGVYWFSPRPVMSPQEIEPETVLTPQAQGTTIYFTPETKNVFAYTLDASTTEKIYLNHHGSKIVATIPSAQDIILLDVPEDVSVFSATTTPSGKVIFTIMYGLGKDPGKVYIYDPLTKASQGIAVAGSEGAPLVFPQLSAITTDESKLMFSSNGCYRCGAGYPYFSLVDLKTGKSVYIGRTVAFEWLEGSGYRYKERIVDPTRSAEPECEYLGCSIAPDKLDWIYGDIKEGTF